MSVLDLHRPHGLDDLAPRLDGGALLVGQLSGRPEHSHHAVAVELHHAARVLLHDLRHRLRVAVHGREDLLGAAALGEARVAPDVHEEHRDLALTGGEFATARELLGDRARDIAAQRLLHRLRFAGDLFLIESAKLRGHLLRDRRQ